MVMEPAISIAPQKEISPSPSIQPHQSSGSSGSIGRHQLTREMQVANAKLGPWNMHWQIDLATAGKILDVAIAAMFWTSRDRPRSLFGNLLGDGLICCAGMAIVFQGRICDSTCEIGCRDQFAFTTIPFSEYFSRGSAAQNSRVDEACEFDAGDVSGGAIDALKVPDSLGPTEASVLMSYPDGQDMLSTRGGNAHPRSRRHCPCGRCP
jgi:hypothetical protein